LLAAIARPAHPGTLSVFCTGALVVVVVVVGVGRAVVVCRGLIVDGGGVVLGTADGATLTVVVGTVGV